MSTWTWLGLGLAILVGLYAAFIATLILAGRRENARAVAGFVPDCTVLLARLLREPSMPRRRWLILGLATALPRHADRPRPRLHPGGWLPGRCDRRHAHAPMAAQDAGRERLVELWPGPLSSLTALLNIAE